MYRCSVKLSVRYDGQSQSESEHASLIDEHARLILHYRYTVGKQIWVNREGIQCSDS